MRRFGSRWGAPLVIALLGCSGGGSGSVFRAVLDASVDGSVLDDARASTDTARDAAVDPHVGADAPAGDRGDVAPDGSSGDGNSDGGADADGGVRASTGCAPLGLLQSSPSPLINAFPVPDGIIVVRNDGLTLLGRDRSVKASVPAAYMISAASFDGATVAVGDGSAVYSFTTALVPRGSLRVMDPCFDSVMAPGHTFVCEPARDRPLLFSTVDVHAGQLLQQSSIQYLAGGRAMEGAAGTPYLALLSGGSPDNYGLYAVDPDGTVRMVQGASSYTEPDLTTVFQFAGTPASHLLTSNGTLLRLLGPGCDGTTTVTTGACLQQDGNIGTLQTGERFTALDSDGAGGLFGLVSHTGRSNLFDPTPCTDGCALQKLDFATRQIVAQQVHRLDATVILFVRSDPTCAMAVVGYQEPPAPSAPASYVYRVDLLDYLPSP